VGCTYCLKYFISVGKFEQCIICRSECYCTVCCRKRFLSDSTNELIETSLISGTLGRWSSFLSSSRQQENPRAVQLSTFEDSSAKYEMYRDELDEYALIDH